MKSDFYDEIAKLGAATRLQLAQDLLDSVASEAFSPPVTDEQRVELRARFAHHRAYPGEATVALEDIKGKLGLS